MAATSIEIASFLSGAVTISVSYNSSNLAMNSLIVTSNGQYTCEFEVWDTIAGTSLTGTQVIPAGGTTVSLSGHSFYSDPTTGDTIGGYVINARCPA